MIKYSFLSLIFLLCLSCSKSKVTPDSVTPPVVVTPPIVRTSGPSSGNFNSDRKYNLNLIYFVPKDIEAIPDHEKRLSELLLWTQNWFKAQMGNAGYANKTFGLFTNETKTRVRIITIYGKKSSTGYPYEGGSTAVMDEVDAYFAENPSYKTSDHNLVILPLYGKKSDGVTPTGGPFYGIGKTCFALDYPEMDIRNLGKTDEIGKRFSVWFGGLVHELGHGINLPHNCQKVSENTNPFKGMALMWAGNGTIGISPTFLTDADCAVLNVNQIFNTDTKEYYGNSTGTITSINATYNSAKQAIVLSGKYASSLPVNSIIYYNDPNVNNEGIGANRDYNAVTWESKTIGNDAFYIEMPISEFTYKDNATPYELRVKLVQNNGNVISTNYSYKFVDGIPVLNFTSKVELSKIGWTIKSFSSEEATGEPAPNGKANVLIDNDINTYWHSKWQNGASNYPHQIIIDLGANKTAEGVSLVQRSGLNRSIKDFEILISDDNITFTPLLNTALLNENGRQNFNFASTKVFRYLKFIAKNGFDGTQFAALAEIGLY
ncbi:MAG: discoidin domain-containing protein [Pedobacter sp.]|nr:MAG: discoidin domain-containing protein [Pedobacter sp.]